MSNKIFIGMLSILLIIAGYVIYKNYVDEKALETSENGVSFRCEDGSGFVAAFSADMDEVKIVVAGRVEHVLPNTGDEMVPYRFGDHERTYTFVGEEVVVADSQANTSVVCNQPSDPNNAPYNFGDTGEGGGEGEDASAAAEENILGAWRSTDDADFIREFRQGGVIVDRYEGAEDTEGTWSAFTSDEGVETPFPQTPNAVYFRVVMNDFPEEVLYFELAKLTPEELELFFLGRGGVLSFTRVADPE